MGDLGYFKGEGGIFLGNMFKETLGFGVFWAIFKEKIGYAVI